MAPKDDGSYLVFISHSTKDRWIARQMANVIGEKAKKYGVRTFLDEKDIEGGDLIPDTIRKNIQECDEFLVLLTRYSINRDWVLLEIGAAWALDKPIISIVSHPEIFSKIPVNLRQIQFLEMKDIDKPEIINQILERWELASA